MRVDYYIGFDPTKLYDKTFAPPMRPAPPTVEDDMRSEIARLREQVATLKATLGMVRQVLAATVENIGTVG